MLNSFEILGVSMYIVYDFSCKFSIPTYERDENIYNDIFCTCKLKMEGENGVNEAVSSTIKAAIWK